MQWNHTCYFQSRSNMVYLTRRLAASHPHQNGHDYTSGSNTKVECFNQIKQFDSGNHISLQQFIHLNLNAIIFPTSIRNFSETCLSAVKYNNDKRKNFFRPITLTTLHQIQKRERTIKKKSTFLSIFAKFPDLTK